MTPEPHAAPLPSRPSWLAHISAGLGLAALLVVVCFHFPDLLTSKEFRATYTEAFARNLLLVGIVASFITGTLAIIRGRSRKEAMLGVGAATIAVLLGGATVSFGPIAATPYSLGLDWFVVSLFFSALAFIPLERLLAVRPLSPLRPGWRTDLGYFFISHVLVQFLLIAATATTTPLAAFLSIKAVQGALQSLPIWAQFGLAVFVADLFQATLHRAYHNVPWLWRFHAVHHSTRHMDWLAGSRIHLLEVIATRSIVLLPLIVLGFAQPAVNAYVVLVGIQAVFAHANVRFDFKALEYLLVTPRYHHWHHARHRDYLDVNYAIHLPLVDMLMGTFKRAPRGEWPEEYGVMKLETVPEGIPAQLLMPFQGGRKFADYVGKADAPEGQALSPPLDP